VRRSYFKKLSSPSFVVHHGSFTPKPQNIPLLEWIKSQINAQEAAPSNLDMLAWMRYYLKKEVVGVESWHTARAKIYDLWKFVNFFYKFYPGKDILLWDKACSQSFVQALEKEYEISTVYRIFATVSNFASFLIIQEAVKAKDNPVKDTKLQEQELPPPRGMQVVSDVSLEGPHYSSKEMFDMLMKSAETFIEEKTPRTRPLRDIAIMSAFYYTGMRCNELCGLTIKQMEIDLTTGGYWFYNVKCKGKRTRKVYLKKEASEHLLNYINSGERSEKSAFIFQSFSGRRLNQADIWRILHRIILKAETLFLSEGNKIFATPHSFRHERGYNLKKAGHGDAFVAQWLGHKDTRQVVRYSRGTEHEEAAILEKV
jgi:site-specific recombinase XerD